MIKRKHIITIGVALLCIILLFAVISKVSRHDSTNNNTTNSKEFSKADNYTIRVVGMGELNLDETFYIPDISIVGKAVYRFVAAQMTNIKPVYEANVRTGSYKISESESSISAQFLVDIPELRRTVRVEIDSDNSSRSGLYVFCPEATEMVYPPTKCTEVDQ